MKSRKKSKDLMKWQKNQKSRHKCS